MNLGIADLINLGISLGLAVYKGITGAKEAQSLVERMVMERRDPTDAEWDQLNKVSLELDTAIARASGRFDDKA
ncbi:hypothetical protein [Ferrovibrio sp.]|uniref:hypothetical protein n=1 Tax=Ferrovibrio sp. TaxID=1917215 RepID=UPI0035B0B656